VTVSEQVDWEIPTQLQPNPRDCAFDLERALLAVVGLRASIPDDAFTASILGTERSGSGVVIRDDGLVLTVGYLVTEAETLLVHVSQAPTEADMAAGEEEAAEAPAAEAPVAEADAE